MEASVIANLLIEPDEQAAEGKPVHVSHSRVSRYLACPEQYRLYYIERLRPRVPAATLVFGQVIHQALAHLFDKKGDPVTYFLNTWAAIQEIPLDYNERDSWEKLKASGERLLAKFVAEEFRKIGLVTAVEESFELGITGLDVPFVGVIDFHGAVNDRLTVVDFKTAAATYPSPEVALSDQLTAYRLAQPSVEQLAICALVKTKEPKIEWHFTSRTGEQLTKYLAKVGYVARDIAEGRFFAIPGKHCAWCDFLPVCLGNKRQVAETLIAV